MKNSLQGYYGGTGNQRPGVVLSTKVSHSHVIEYQEYIQQQMLMILCKTDEVGEKRFFA